MEKNEVLLQVKMIEKGIIPYLFPYRNIQQGLDSLSEPEKVKTKRKFRKLWRKAIRKHRYDSIRYRNLCASCGVGLAEEDLTSHHYRYRAFLVRRELGFQI